MARFFCKVGGRIGDVGELKFGFYAPKHCYEQIGDELGIKRVTGNGQGISYGGTPKPPRVRLTYLIPQQGTVEGTDNDLRRSVVRFCDPDKLGQVLGGSLIGKKLKIRYGDEFRQYRIIDTSMAS